MWQHQAPHEAHMLVACLGHVCNPLGVGAFIWEVFRGHPAHRTRVCQRGRAVPSCSPHAAGVPSTAHAATEGPWGVCLVVFNELVWQVGKRKLVS